MKKNKLLNNKNIYIEYTCWKQYVLLQRSPAKDQNFKPGCHESWNLLSIGQHKKYKQEYGQNAVSAVNIIVLWNWKNEEGLYNLWRFKSCSLEFDSVTECKGIKVSFPFASLWGVVFQQSYGINTSTQDKYFASFDLRFSSVQSPNYILKLALYFFLV